MFSVPWEVLALALFSVDRRHHSYLAAPTSMLSLFVCLTRLDVASCSISVLRFWVLCWFLVRQEYIVRDNEVLIVDTFSGRVLEGRRYSDGLHQCIEAKEGVCR